MSISEEEKTELTKRLLEEYPYCDAIISDMVNMKHYQDIYKLDKAIKKHGGSMPAIITGNGFKYKISFDYPESSDSDSSDSDSSDADSSDFEKDKLIKFMYKRITALHKQIREKDSIINTNANVIKAQLNEIERLKETDKIIKKIKFLFES